MEVLLHPSSVFHPREEEQSERKIQISEDILGSCVINVSGSWDTYLPLAEFFYSNGYYSGVGMLPYELKCKTPVCWGKVGQRELSSTEIVQQTTECIQQIRGRLKVAQDRQKCYADKRRSLLEFQMGDYELLKVAPW